MNLTYNDEFPGSRQHQYGEGLSTQGLHVRRVHKGTGDLILSLIDDDSNYLDVVRIIYMILLRLLFIINVS